MSEFKNLPPEVADAIDRYDADVATGVITFDAEGAATYPGETKTDEALGAFVASKMEI